MKVATVAAHSSRGTLGEHQRHLWPLRHLEIQSLEAEVLADHDVVVLGLPHGASAALTAQIEQINPDALIIDLGADHRLTDPAAWERYYHSEAAEPWTYGMPELIRATGLTQRELLAATRRIAAPGCNASAVTFAVQPAIAAGLASGEDIVAILSVGYSGAGKSPKTHLLASEAIESATPYAVGGTHRHIPEIAQNLITAGAPAVSLSFTPVLVPMSRGILATVSIPVEGVSPERVSRPTGAPTPTSPSSRGRPTGLPRASWRAPTSRSSTPSSTPTRGASPRSARSTIWSRAPPGRPPSR